MPRNSSGVYQLPSGNPVVSGSLIESVWANSTMSDLAQAITDSLDRFGRSTMAAPMLLNDGTVAAPGMAFGAESTTGIFRKSAKVLGISAGGQEIASFSQAAGVTIPGNLTIGSGGFFNAPEWRPVGAAGAAATATISPMPDNAVLPGTDNASIRLFRNTNTTGIRNLVLFRGDASGTADHIFTAGTTGILAQLAINGGQVAIGGAPYGTLGIRDGGAYGGGGATTVADALVIESNADSGMSFLTPNDKAIRIQFGDNDSNNQGQIAYLHATDVLSFSAAAAARFQISAAGPQVMSGAMLLLDGTAATPAAAFTAQASWGIFRVPAIGIGFAVSGVEAARIAAAGITLSAGAASLFHNDTTTNLSIVAAASLIDGVARIDLYDSAHATLPRQVYIRGRGIVFTDSTLANEKAHFSASTDRTDFVIGRPGLNGLLTLANRGLIEADGSAGSLLALDFNGARCGYAYGKSATEFQISSGLTTVAMTFCLNGAEVARVDTDSTLNYSAPSVAQQEVGFRNLPVLSKSAVYNLRAIDRGCCIVQTAAANVITAAVFGAGDVVSISNKQSAGTAAIGIIATGIALNWGTGTPLTGNRSLANNGLATLYFTAANVATLTGSGIS